MTGLSLFDSIRKIFGTGEGEDRSSLSRKVQESPQDPQARQKLGLFLLRQGEIVEGTDQLARAAILYEKSGFTTKAIAVLRQLLKNDPANIDFQRWLIRLFAQQGHTGDALSELQKVAAGGTWRACRTIPCRIFSSRTSTCMRGNCWRPSASWKRPSLSSHRRAWERSLRAG